MRSSDKCSTIKTTREPHIKHLPTTPPTLVGQHQQHYCTLTNDTPHLLLASKKEKEILAA